MKVSGFCVLFLLVVATALVFFNFFSPTGLAATNSGDGTTMIAVSRKLKENGTSIRSNNKGSDKGNVTLDDYNPIDPVPSSSKAALTPGPIEHGTPLMPFIPKPSPPNHPKLGGSK